MYLAPLEVIGIPEKFEEAVEVNCLGSKGDGGEDGYFTVFAMGPPSDFEVQKGESLETSEHVMERYLCWVEFFLQIAFMKAFDIHAKRMNLVMGVYTQLISTLKHPLSNMFINIVVTGVSGTSVKRIFNTYPPGFPSRILAAFRCLGMEVSRINGDRISMGYFTCL